MTAATTARVELAAAKAAVSELSKTAEAARHRIVELENSLQDEKSRRMSLEKELSDVGAACADKRPQVHIGNGAAGLRREEVQCLKDVDLEVLQGRLEDGLDVIRRENKRRLELQKNRLRDSLDQNMCAVCLESEKCIMFAPCNHICACEGCGGRVDKCPMCQSVVTSRVKVYL